jgi:HlyD family secretion protein
MSKYLAFLLGAAAVGIVWMARQSLWHEPAPVRGQPLVAQAAPPKNSVGCIGRFTTDDPIVRVAAPYFESRPSVVAQLFVREGEWVKAGQTVAWLDGKRQLEAERAKAVADLERAQRVAAQVRAGAKASEIAAQTSDIARLESSSQLAIKEYRRDEQLFESHNIPAAQLERSRSTLETNAHAVKEAQHRLTALTEVRREDVAVADADIEVAKASLAEIDARLVATTIVAPVAGRVIQIHAHPGERAEPDGILELADTTKMSVEAEVYAVDVQSVRPGQHASIRAEDGNGAKLSGEVTSVGARVRKPAVLPNDPVAYSDAHVVPVRIHVSGCGEGACPIDGRVNVVIETNR